MMLIMRLKHHGKEKRGEAIAGKDCWVYEDSEWLITTLSWELMNSEWYVICSEGHVVKAYVCDACSVVESTNLHGPTKLLALGSTWQIIRTSLASMSFGGWGKDFPETECFIRSG